MQHARVELPGVPEGLSVYVTQYLPQSDKKAGKGELKLQVKAFGGVTMGRPRYSWKHPSIFQLPDASAAIEKLVAAYPALKLRKTIANIGAALFEEPAPLPKRKPTDPE